MGNYVKLGRCDHCSVDGLGVSGVRVGLIAALLLPADCWFGVRGYGERLYISHFPEVYLQYQSPPWVCFQKSSQMCDVGTDNGCSEAPVCELLRNLCYTEV